MKLHKIIVRGDKELKLKMNNQQEIRDTKDIIEEFMNECKSKGLSKSTLQVYQTNIKYLMNYLDSKKIKLKDVKTNIINDYKEYTILTTERNNTSINTHLRHLKIFFNWTEENGYTDKIVIKYLKVQQKAKEIYSDEEIKILLRKPKIDDCTYTELRTWTMINLLVSTGIRRTSLLNIKLEDIIWNKQLIKLSHTKNKQVHFVNINKQLIKVLKEWLKYRIGESDYLFTGQTGKKLSEYTVSSTIADYCKSREVSVTSCHAFRHYFSQKLVSSGIDIFTISKLLGHSNITITQNYLKSLNMENFISKNSVNIFDLLE